MRARAERRARAVARLRGDNRAKAVAIDGYTALNAYVPPKERRGLVLIDPPFEQPDEFEQLAQGLAGAHRKWPTGIYALWYPIKDDRETEGVRAPPHPPRPAAHPAGRALACRGRDGAARQRSRPRQSALAAGKRACRAASGAAPCLGGRAGRGHTLIGWLTGDR